MGSINTSVERRENFSLSLGMDEKERQLTPDINDEWRKPSKEKKPIENTKTTPKSQTYKNLLRNNDFSTNTGLDSRKYLSTGLKWSQIGTALELKG